MNLASTIIFNSFWIIGLALLLATLSHTSYEASVQKRPFKELIQQANFQQAAHISALLVGIGLAGTSQTLWETIIWAIFAIINTGLAITIKSSSKNKLVFNKQKTEDE